MKATNEVAAEPGYVRMVLADAADLPDAACREFLSLCTRENAGRGLIVNRCAGDGPRQLERTLVAIGGSAPAGFKLAVVDRKRRWNRHGALATRKVRAKVFRSEHAAAAWLLG